MKTMRRWTARSFVSTVAVSALFALTSIRAHAQEPSEEPKLTPEQLAELFKEPPSHLAPMPAIDFDSTLFKANAEEQQEIKELIEQLTQIEKPDYGMAPWMSGSQFAPVKSSREMGAGIIMVNHGLETMDEVTRLVVFGPKAIPALLEAIDDKSESKLVMEHGGGMGAMWYGREVQTNPVNGHETNVIQAKEGVQKPGSAWGDFESNIKRHVITRGDICFNILGQIVNRNYEASRYQPTACRVINSPSNDLEIASVLRQIWQSEDSAKFLFDSLLIDFHSQGGAKSFQNGAAMRLLYYFTDQSADLIIKRLDSFAVNSIINAEDPGEAWRKRMEINGTRVPDFIKSVAFSDQPDVRQAIIRVIKRTDDPSIFHECLTLQVVETEPELILERMKAIISIPPPATQGPFGGEYHTLRAAVRFFPDKSQALFDTYLDHGTLECRRATIHALAKPEQPVPWAVLFLKPLLDDRTDTGWQYGPSYDRKPIRICDEAAKILAEHYIEGALFEYEQNPEYLDTQIAKLKSKLAGKEVAFERPTEWAMPTDLATRKAMRVLEFDMSLWRIYPISDGNTLWIGNGYRSDIGYAWDTLKIDAVSGEIVDRTNIEDWHGSVKMLPAQSATTVYSHDPNEHGRINERDVRTGELIRTFEVPFRSFFHGGRDIKDQTIMVTGMGELYLTGDGRKIICATQDGAINSFDIETGVHTKPWKYEGENPFKGSGFHTRLTFLKGTNRILVEGLPGIGDAPLLMWDHDTQTMNEVMKVPEAAWRGGWGDLAWQKMNGYAELWNIAKRTEIKLPQREVAIDKFLCDSDQSTLFSLRTDGVIDVFRIIDGVRAEPIHRLRPSKEKLRYAMSLSADDGTLFLTGNPPRSSNGERPEKHTVIDIFDVGDLTK